MADLTQVLSPIGVTGFSAQGTVAFLPQASLTPQTVSSLRVTGFSAQGTVAFLPQASLTPQVIAPIGVTMTAAATSFFGYRMWLSHDFMTRRLLYCPLVS